MGQWRFMILQSLSFTIGQQGFGMTENKQMQLVDHTRRPFRVGLPIFVAEVQQAQIRSVLNLTDRANEIIDDYYSHKWRLTKSGQLGEVTVEVNKLRWEAWSKLTTPCNQSTKSKQSECQEKRLGSCWSSFKTKVFNAPRPDGDGVQAKPEIIRQLCWRDRLVPTVFMLGGQKCGSTAVVNLITEHKLLPLVHALGVKEPKFFVDLKLCKFFTLACALPIFCKVLPFPFKPTRSHDFAFRPFLFQGSQGCGFYFWQNLWCYSKHNHQLEGINPAAKVFGPETKGMDATTFFASATVAAKIERVYGPRQKWKARFVIMLRDPAARVKSWFGHFQAFDKYKADGYIDADNNITSYGEFLRDQMDGLEAGDASGCTEVSGIPKKYNAICGSVYITWLKEWVRHFHPQQFLILSFSDFIHDPRPSILAIADHLSFAPTLAKKVLPYCMQYIDLSCTPYIWARVTRARHTSGHASLTVYFCRSTSAGFETSMSQALAKSTLVRISGPGRRHTL
jgi:hypothetical protein